jgi:hypothetical protein
MMTDALSKLIVEEVVPGSEIDCPASSPGARHQDVLLGDMRSEIAPIAKLLNDFWSIVLIVFWIGVCSCLRHRGSSVHRRPSPPRAARP